MKYPALVKDKAKEFLQDKLDGGLNLYNEAQLISDNQLSKAENVVFANGSLKSRKGLKINRESILGRCESEENFEKGLTLTDTEVFYRNKSCKIAYSMCGDLDSFEFLHIYFVDPQKSLISVGNLFFQRLDSDIYYMFDNIIFLVAEKHSGSGIYAYVTRTDASSSESIYEIYELSATFDSWTYLNDPDYYEPVILINGRGINYETAAKERDVYSAAPGNPENFNMLTNRFKAYYSSDGSSSQFNLPVTKLTSNSQITCKIYTTPAYYDQWVINPGESSAVTLTSSGNVTMYCNRNTGYVYFKDSDGNPYIPANSYVISGNNIVIEAERLKDSQMGCIVSSRGCQIYNSNVYFYGNYVNPDRIYCARISNPLYFPENMKTSVGNPTERVTAMAVQNNKLIAFKESQIYKINVAAAENNSGYSELLGNAAGIFKNDRLTASLVHESVGCCDRRTLAVCGNRLVWLGTDKKVYTLATTTFGKENNVYCLSTPVNNLFKDADSADISKAFAFDSDGYYILCIGSSLFLVDYRIKNFGISAVYTGLRDDADSISWYVWRLPEQIYCSGGVIGGDNCLFIEDESKAFTGIAVFEGDKDETLTANGSSYIISEKNIESAVCSRRFDMGIPEKSKNIDEINIIMEFSGSADIIVRSESTEYAQTVFSENRRSVLVKLMPFIKNSYGISVEIHSDTPMSINGIGFKYHTLS